jgi:hypothetical protein
MRDEQGDREGHPYISCRIEAAFSSMHNYLKSYDQQDFRRVM